MVIGRVRQWFSSRGMSPEAIQPVIPEAAWSRAEGILPWLAGLGSEGRDQLERLSAAFLDRHAIETVGMSADELPEEAAAVIALQACAPVLDLGLDAYESWHTILIYPSGFVVAHEYEDEAGVVHQDTGPLIGEAWEGGPMVLSLEDAVAPQPGTSVVIHECAHKLDMRNGVVNGFPVLRADMSAKEWEQAFSSAYAALHSQLDAGVEGCIDPYAAEDPGEFLAVTLETYCAAPRALREAFPAVYAQWQRLLGVDPLALGTGAGPSVATAPRSRQPL